MDHLNTGLLNEVYREIGERLGMDTAVEIHRMYQGQQISFPVHLYSSKYIRENVIREYDGNNLRDLVKKYGYSEKTIRRMLQKNEEVL